MGRKKSSKSTARPIAKKLPLDSKSVPSIESLVSSPVKTLLNHALVAAGLFVLVLLAWSNSFGDGFVLDNRFFILLDPRVHQATSENIGLILNRGYWYTYNSGLYRPLTTLSYLFNYAILGNGEQPAGYHWVNILLHFANAFLVYVLSLRLLRKFWPAVFIASVWAVHPVLTESVTNIIGRADLLAGFAQLSGLLMYLKSTEAAGRQKAVWLAGLMAVTTLGVFSKESAVAILGVIVLYELVWWKERKQLRGLLLGCAALAPPLLFMWYRRFVVLSASGPMKILFTDNPLKYATFVRSRLTATVIMAKYLWLLVWPLKLSSDYSYNQIPIASGTLREWIAWLSVLGVTVCAAFLFKRSRAAFFFGGFALLSFVPVSNILVYTGTIMAERFLYLPAIGFAGCLVMAVYWIGGQIGRPQLAPIVLCLIIAMFAARTWARNLDWHDNVALWASAVRVSPNSAKAHEALASVMYASDPAGSIDRAIAEDEKSLAILDPLPDNENAANVYADAGRLYSVKGDLLAQAARSNGQSTITPASLAAYQRGLQILTRGIAIEKSSDETLRSEERGGGTPGPEMASTNLPFLYSSTALTYVRLGKYQEAYDAAARASALSPLLGDAYVSMGEALLSEGSREDAAISFLEAFLITGDKGLLPFIHSAYSGGLDKRDCAFRNTAGGPTLDISCQLVHTDVCKASDNLIKLLLRDQNQTAADQIKRKAIENLECSTAELQ